MCQKGGPPATFWYVVPCLVTVITAGEMSLVHTFYMERDIFFPKNRGGTLCTNLQRYLCRFSQGPNSRFALGPGVRSFLKGGFRLDKVDKWEETSD